MKEKTEKKKIRVGAVIFRIFLILVAGLTVGLAVFSFNANHIGGNQLPMPFGYGASVVLSGSMEPTLAVNDLVVVEAEEDYDVGDVVVFQNGKDLIIHRVVKKDGEEFTTRGDANNADDDPINLSEIKGKMIFKIPFIGLIFKWLKTLPGTLIVLGLAIFLLYRSRRKERDKDSQKLDVIVEEINRLRELQKEEEQKTASAAVQDAPAKPKEKQEPSEVQPETENPPEPVEKEETSVAQQPAEEKPAEDPASADEPTDEAAKKPADPEKEDEQETDPVQEDSAKKEDDFSDLDALINEIENDNN